MSNSIRKIVVVGGGAAGWLTAGTIAAEHDAGVDTGISVTLVESPDVATIGVGEGTWPTMRRTLSRLGISETEFIRQCDASFKQGTRFDRWHTGADGDRYYHPFSLPMGYTTASLIPNWQARRREISFADALSVQSHICERGLAPKQSGTPEYAAVVNYGYHLDAGKFSQVLQKHCTEVLGVQHVLDHVTGINAADNGDIVSLDSKLHGVIEGDLFVDCTGFASLLLGKHYGVPFIGRKDNLFIDSALAVQVPYPSPDSPIESQTISTAQSAGWVWDIGLSSRRGVGYVYSSAHISESEAEAELRDYIEPSLGKEAESVDLRKISINPGHRQEFWHRNCVAVGMSAGFLEPLEASALVLVELSAEMLSEQLPVTRDTMDIVARRFNEKFRYRWDRVIDFLKLHYVLSERADTDFWIENRAGKSIPDSLEELLTLWRRHYPVNSDFSQIGEVFSAASYQYVLYGMGFETVPGPATSRPLPDDNAERKFAENAENTRKMLAGLPSNRELINAIKESGLRAA